VKREKPVVSSKLARFTERVVSLAQKAVVGEPAPAFAPGETGYADWVIVALHGLREYLGHSYRQLLDVLHEMPRIVSKLDLAVGELPDFTTVCTRMQDLEMTRWRVLLRLSADLHEPGEVQAIDATGFDRRAASRRYARRTNYTFRAVKTTVLVDCDTSTILDIHCSMKRPHDTQIGEQLLKRNLDRLEIITADKGYDWDELRQKLREADVRPVIKHREFSSLDAAHNARLDDDTYHRRSVVESVIHSLKRRFGDTLRARTWFGQFRELALKAAVKNIEAALSA
jgi:IS5 family transposase